MTSLLLIEDNIHNSKSSSTVVKRKHLKAAKIFSGSLHNRALIRKSE